MDAEHAAQPARARREPAWRRHRRLRALPMSVLAFGIVFVLAAGTWPPLRGLVPFVGGVLTFAFVLALVFVNATLARFRCPGCNKPFNGQLIEAGRPRGDIGRACGHCGLPLYG